VALQLWLAHRYFGFLTGDDVEIISEAFRVATGYHYQAWNVRNEFIPQWVVAPPIWIAAKLGVHDVGTLIVIATLPFIAAYVATIWLVHRLALRWSGNDTTALVAALLYALHWIPLGFGSTVYPRTIATLCIVGAALLVCRPELTLLMTRPSSALRAPSPERRRLSMRQQRRADPSCAELPLPSGGGGPFGFAQGKLRPGEGLVINPSAAHGAVAQLGTTANFIAGLLVGIAFADRFSEIVFLVPLLLIARKRLALLAGAAVSIALTAGVHDWIVWGAPFSSLRNFAHLTIAAPDFASRIKYQSPAWYLETLPRWCALTLLPLLWRARRDWRPFAFIVIPLIALSLIRHKELRYVQGIIPFLAIAAAIGFTTWDASALGGVEKDRRRERRRHMISIGLLAISIVWDAYGIKTLTRKSMPAVMAARAIAANPNIKTVAVSQIWAYGGWLYFGDRKLIELETPPRTLDVTADAVAVYETDPIESLRGYVRWRTFRDGSAKVVVVFTPAASGTSDRARR
jgi:hypothetical protein